MPLPRPLRRAALAVALTAGALPAAETDPVTSTATAHEPREVLRWVFAAADRVEVEHLERFKRVSRDLRVDLGLRHQIDTLVADAPFDPKPYCFCSMPGLLFYRDGQCFARLTVPHGEKFRFSVAMEKSGFSGDFFVGPEVGRRFLRLIHDRDQADRAMRVDALVAAEHVLENDPTWRFRPPGWPQIVPEPPRFVWQNLLIN